ncbi:alpha/beta hydrolase [Rhodococcus triatomae]|nr:lipase/esterase [Rhodococcus triatomae BKS 15-14]
MPLLDNLRPLYDAMSARQPDPTVGVVERRAAAHSAYRNQVVPLYGPAPESGSVTELDLQVSGSISLPSRLYRPSHGRSDDLLPVHLYLHGGGFWSGTPELFDIPCLRTAVDTRCAVLSIGYRLAPEHLFPAAVEDAYAALLWLASNAESMGLDASRTSIGGSSAGGGLAAAVALLCRDRGGPDLLFQVLEVPAVDLRPEALLQVDPEGRRFALDELRESSARYLGNPTRALEPLASPLLAPDLSGLPPALVMTAEYDPLREAGETFAARLEDAGVSTSLHMWPGQFHGSQRFETLIPEQARTYHQIVVTALREAYVSTGRGTPAPLG